MIRAVLVLLLAALSSTPIVSIKVSAPAILVNGTTRITCTVPRHAENRELQAGIVDYQSSSRQLDGEQSRMTWEFTFSHIPCGSAVAFCAVRRTTRDSLVTHMLTVGGCES